MTALTRPVARAGTKDGRWRRLRALAAVEARRTARSTWLWTGAAGTLAMLSLLGDADYQSGSYTLATAGFTALALGVFVHAVHSGGRDRAGVDEAVAPAAVMDGDERATARLLGLWPGAAIGLLAALVLGVGERIEGGYWVGESLWRTDAQVHSVLELSQIPALVAFAAAAGLAAGRASRRRGLVSVLGAVAAAALGFTSWAWQWVPARYVTLVQTQPIELDLGPGFALSDTPDGWLLAGPNEFESSWRRVVVHEAMAGWHSVYLIGLAVLLAGLAVRGRAGARLALAGVLVAVTGVVAQVLVAPASPAV
jgi:hypothetical protein